MIFEDVTEGTNGLVVLLLADMNLTDVHERIVSEWVLGKALCEGLEEFKRFVVLFGLVDVLSSRKQTRRDRLFGERFLVGQQDLVAFLKFLKRLHDVGI